MTSHRDEEPAFDTPEGFALRVKHQKHVFCVPVDPKTKYDELAQICLSLLDKSTIEAPPSYTGASSFDELQSGDLAFFDGSYAAATSGSTASEELRFVEINRSKSTIGAMGLKDGADAVVYIGFRNKDSDKMQKPDVSIPPTYEDEEDEELDEGFMMVDEVKGKK